jgi:hypothetical protein
MEALRQILHSLIDQRCHHIRGFPEALHQNPHLRGQVWGCEGEITLAGGFQHISTVKQTGVLLVCPKPWVIKNIYFSIEIDN